jgi:hypothetical protein
MACVQSITVWEDQAISAGASLLSQRFDLGQWSDLMGYFSLYVELTGDGTGKFQWASSPNNNDYIISADASDDIVTAHTDVSGPDADGKHIYQFSPITAQWLKIKVTETGTSDGITVTSYLSIH